MKSRQKGSQRTQCNALRRGMWCFLLCLVSGRMVATASRARYKVISSEEVPWEDARAACVGDDGFLPTPVNADENDAIFAVMTAEGLNKAWLGAFKGGGTPNWLWMDGPHAGEAFGSLAKPCFEDTYCKWSPIEPNNGGSIDLGLQMWGPGQGSNPGGHWNDHSATALTFFICQYSAATRTATLPRSGTLSVTDTLRNSASETESGTVSRTAIATPSDSFPLTSTFPLTSSFPLTATCTPTQRVPPAATTPDIADAATPSVRNGETAASTSASVLAVLGGGPTVAVVGARSSVLSRADRCEESHLSSKDKPQAFDYPIQLALLEDSVVGYHAGASVLNPALITVMAGAVVLTFRVSASLKVLRIGSFVASTCLMMLVQPTFSSIVQVLQYGTGPMKGVAVGGMVVSLAALVALQLFVFRQRPEFEEDLPDEYESFAYKFTTATGLWYVRRHDDEANRTYNWGLGRLHADYTLPFLPGVEWLFSVVVGVLGGIHSDAVGCRVISALLVVVFLLYFAMHILLRPLAVPMKKWATLATAFFLVATSILALVGTFTGMDSRVVTALAGCTMALQFVAVTTQLAEVARVLYGMYRKHGAHIDNVGKASSGGGAAAAGVFDPTALSNPLLDHDAFAEAEDEAPEEEGEGDEAEAGYEVPVDAMDGAASEEEDEEEL